MTIPCIRNPGILKPEGSEHVSVALINSNYEVIDGLIAKNKLNGVVDPAVTNDLADGYSIGSVWINVVDHSIFFAEDVTTGAAVWNQIYPVALPVVPSWSINEVPAGTINGVNVTFTLAHTPTGQIMLYLNGQYMTPGAGEDYTISGSTITMAAAPIVGDKIRTNYQY